VAFNNHAGSTKSYDYVRAHNEAVNRIDFIDLADPPTGELEPGGTMDIPQADGSTMRLRRIAADFDPTDRIAVMDYVSRHQAHGEVVTGLLYVDPEPEDLHAHLNTVAAPFNRLGDAELVPGAKALEAVNRALR
jgi:2-oxoglutarate ferredoxin oxidoreductase subunit beta